MVIKGGGGLSGLAKGAGMLAVGGELSNVLYCHVDCHVLKMHDVCRTL